MDTETKNIIVIDSFEELGSEIYKDYLAHALCIGGTCRFLFNSKEFDLNAGDVLIIRKGKLMEKIRPSTDFRVKVIYVTPNFIELCTPQSNYGMKGQLSLFLNPVMHLLPAQQEICRRNFEMVEARLEDSNHHFYREIIINTVQTMILDFYDFHSHLYGEECITTQSASIMNRFLRMLDEGTYRECREITYYASELCVTSKYLSEVSKRVSGYPANYWINRYTILDISRLLRDKSYSFVQISDLFRFSSPAYFSRYVQHHLGLNPTDYRE